MPQVENSKFWFNSESSELQENVNQELLFLRAIALIGMLALPTLSIVYEYLRPGENHIFYARFVLGLAAFLTFSASFLYKNQIKKYNQELLFCLIFSFSILQIFNNYNLDFPPLDTTTNVTNIFILGAILNRKDYMISYMTLSACLFLVFVWIHPNPISDRQLILINTPIIAMMALVVYYNKIHYLKILENSKAKLEESEARFRTVFESAPMGITVVDRKGKVIQFNEAALNILDLTEEEYLKTKPEDIIHPDDYEAIEVLYDKLMSQPDKVIQEERRYLKKDGSMIWTNAMFALDVNLDEIIITNEDISARKKAEVSRKAYNERLKQSNESLEHFSYVISHDLQEPLRMISMYTQRIKKKYLPQIKSEEASVDMDFVVDGAKRMGSLIRDLLEYSRVSSVESIVDEINIEDLLVYVRNDLSISIQESNAQLEYQGEIVSILANKILLKQVFFNLVSNAIKYKAADRDSLIVIDCIKRDFDYLFTIKDNGIGFESQYNKRIFLLFQRLHHRDSYSGTGIGLAICQKCIQQMGGEIWAEGKEGIGATFYFTIPLEMD